MQRPREGMNLHWDGNNASVTERNFSAALGAGVSPVSVDTEALYRIRDWITDLEAPPFPKPDLIDQSKLARGEELYTQYCASCHGMKVDGTYDYRTTKYPYLGEVVPLREIGTDIGRWASYTQGFADVQNTLYSGYDWQFKNFKKTDGYANSPLDGIWARSPYLHNGSVPTLYDLLLPASERPLTFYLGTREYDPEKVGFKTTAGNGNRFLFRAN